MPELSWGSKGNPLYLSCKHHTPIHEQPSKGKAIMSYI